MINKIKLAIKIILGYDIIVYEENTRIVIAMINGNEDILKNRYNYAIDKYICDNNDEIRYLKGSD